MHKVGNVCASATKWSGVWIAICQNDRWPSNFSISFKKNKQKKYAKYSVKKNPDPFLTFDSSVHLETTRGKAVFIFRPAKHCEWKLTISIKACVICADNTSALHFFTQRKKSWGRNSFTQNSFCHARDHIKLFLKSSFIRPLKGSGSFWDFLYDFFYTIVKQFWSISHLSFSTIPCFLHF